MIQAEKHKKGNVTFTEYFREDPGGQDTDYRPSIRFLRLQEKTAPNGEHKTRTMYSLEAPEPEAQNQDLTRVHCSAPRGCFGEPGP